MSTDPYTYYREKDEFDRDFERRHADFVYDLDQERTLRNRDADEARRAQRARQTAWAVHKMGGTEIAIDHLNSTADDDAYLDDDDVDVHEPETPTAEAQFMEHHARLVHLLETCTVLPKGVIERWLNIVKLRRESDLGMARQRIDAVLNDHQHAHQRYQPSVFDVAKGMQFLNEMNDIKVELHWLAAILAHVQNYIDEGR